MLWTLRLSLILLIAGIFLSPQIIAYAVAVSVMRLWRLTLKAFARVKTVMRRIPAFSSIPKEVS